MASSLVTRHRFVPGCYGSVLTDVPKARNVDGPGSSS